MCFISYFRRSAQYDENHQDGASPEVRTPRTSQEQREHTAKKAQDRKEWIKAAKAKEKQEKKEKSSTKHEKRKRQRIQRHSSSEGSFYIGEDMDGCGNEYSLRVHNTATSDVQGDDNGSGSGDGNNASRVNVGGLGGDNSGVGC